MLGGFLRAGMKMSSLFLQRISLWWNLTSTLVKIHSKGISDVHLHGNGSLHLLPVKSATNMG